MEREQIVFAHIDTGGRGLEIGPSHSPLAPKSEGFNVVIVDHATKDELVSKYRKLGVTEDRLARIEDVDYLWEGQPLSELVPGQFDYVLASHLIEHTVDLISFLQDCEKLLKPGGILSLVIPDKRYCFDILRPLSTTGQVLDSHIRPSVFHTPGTMFEAHTYASTRHGVVAWDAGHTEPVAAIAEDLDFSIAILEAAQKQEVYQDTHHWVFCPSSFELILNDLQRLDYTGLVIAGTHGTIGCEFYVSLQSGRTKPESSPTRTELFKRIELELAEVSAFATSESAQIKRLKKQVKQLKASNKALTDSVSWRVTKPIRATKSRVRNLTNR